MNNRLFIIKNKGSAHGAMVQGYATRLRYESGRYVGNSVYWSPSNGSLNDFQYIKCKWLFELLTGSFTSIHKEYGFISPDTSGKKNVDWPALAGHFFRFYSLFLEIK